MLWINKKNEIRFLSPIRLMLDFTKVLSTQLPKVVMALLSLSQHDTSFEHWHNLPLHQNRVNLGQFRVNLNQNLDKVVKNKGFMRKKLIYDKWKNDKKWEIFEW